MKKLFFLIAILFTANCLADKSYDQIMRDVNALVEKIDKSNELKYKKEFFPESSGFSGIHETKYPEGSKRSEISYKYGKVEGLAIWWYQNGRKDRETNYKNGKKNGIQIEFSENGVKRSEINYKDDKEDGLSKYWFDNGEYQEKNFKDGKLNGLFTSWENNIKSLEINYRNGKENGVEKIWDKNGILIEQNDYKNGKLINHTNLYQSKIKNYESKIKNEIIIRCKNQMSKHGAAIVKACVDQDIDAYNELKQNSYVDKYKAITTRCIDKMNMYGWSIIKACADQDIKAEAALDKY